MDTRRLLSRRPGPPIYVPSRPSIGIPRGQSSVEIASSSLWSGSTFEGGLLPVAADVRATNLETRPVEARLVLIDSRGRTLGTAPVSLGANESVQIPDVASDWFGVPNASGSLRLETRDGSEAALHLEVRSYPRSAAARADSESRFLIDLARNGNSGSEIETFNPSNRSEFFEITLRSRTGASMGATGVLTLLPGEHRMWNLEDLFANAAGSGMTTEVSAAAGSGFPVTRAAIVDLRTGGRIVADARPPSERVYFPVTGRTDGAGATYLTTEVALASVADVPIDVRVRFLQNDRDNPAPVSATVRLGPRETRPMEDLLLTLFGLTEVSGFLEVEASRPALVAAARLSARTEGSGTVVGEAIEPVAPERLSRVAALSLSLLGDGSSPMIVLFNPDAGPLPVLVRLEDEAGRFISDTTVVVPRHSAISLDPESAFPIAPTSASPVVRVVAEASTPFFPFTSSSAIRLPRAPDRGRIVR